MFLPDLPGPHSQIDAYAHPGPAQAQSEPVLQRARGAAKLRLISDAGANTRLARLFQAGCLKVRLPRPDVDGVVDAVLINTSGGLTGGDELSIEIDLDQGARATVTTPACERIYRSIGGEACIQQHLRVSRGARLDWVPQETILFDQSRLRRRLDIELQGNAEITVSEAFLFGRTAMGETIKSGLLCDFWTVRRDGELLFADAMRIADPFDETVACPVALRGCVAMASLAHVGTNLQAKRDELRCGFAQGHGSAAVSVVGDVLLARVVTSNSRELRGILIPALHALRERRPLPRNWLC